MSLRPGELYNTSAFLSQEEHYQHVDVRIPIKTNTLQQLIWISSVESLNSELEAFILKKAFFICSKIMFIRFEFGFPLSYYNMCPCLLLSMNKLLTYCMYGSAILGWLHKFISTSHSNNFFSFTNPYTLTMKNIFSWCCS